MGTERSERQHTDDTTGRQTTPRTLLTLGEISARIGVSRGRLWTIRRDDPSFPPPVFLGPSRRWRLSEIEEWEASLPREPRAWAGLDDRSGRGVRLARTSSSPPAKGPRAPA